MCRRIRDVSRYFAFCTLTLISQSVSLTEGNVIFPAIYIKFGFTFNTWGHMLLTSYILKMKHEESMPLHRQCYS